MRSSSIAIAFLALTVALVGCKREEHGHADDHGHDHGTPQVATTAPAAPKSAAEFVSYAGSGLLLLVTASDMAQKTIAHEADKKFAAEMSKEYTALLTELESLAKAKNAKLPEEPQGEHRKVMEAMMQLKGEGFESAFHKVIGAEHLAMASYLQSADASLADAEVKAFAAKAGPALKEHGEQLSKHDHGHAGHDHKH